MREHPVPQDVTGYQFHIIGEMTIKQFAEIGAGCMLGFFIYLTNLPLIIKWPFIGVVVAAGALAAFVPFEERMLDHWIITFFRVLYKPTKYFWKREPHIPDVFTYETINKQPVLPEVDLTPARRQRIREFITSLDDRAGRDQFDEYQHQRVDQILSTFNQVTTATLDVKERQTRPNLDVRVRSLTAHEEVHQETAVGSADLAATQTWTTQDYQPLQKDQLAVAQAAAEIEIPTAAPTTVDHNYTAESAAAAATPITEATMAPAAPVIMAPPMTDAVAAPQAAAQTQFNTSLPFPTAPTQPNRPVGMVLGPNNELIPNAIVELTNVTTGAVARAVKTNTLGQFYITTPMDDGEYVITIDDDHHQYVPQQLTLAGTAVPPIEIRGY